MRTAFPSANAAGDLAGYDTQFLRRRRSKVIIQESATRRYLSHTGVWVADIEEAMTFQSGSKAVEHALRLKLTHVQLILTRDITTSEVISIHELLH